MRLLSFNAADGLHIGAITNGALLISRFSTGSTNRSRGSIKGGQLDDLATLLANCRDQVHHQIKDLILLLPISRPGKFYVLGLIIWIMSLKGRSINSISPAIFMRSSTSLVAANEPIRAPLISQTLDYEAELQLSLEECKNLVKKML